MKTVEHILHIIFGLAMVYFVLVGLIIFVSWVWGIEPVHYLPGMTEYANWKIGNK